MKILNSLFTTAALAAVLIYGASPSISKASEATEDMLIDFTDSHKDPGPNGMVFHPFQYAYEMWDKHVIELPGRGVLIKAPSGKGGLGENSTTVEFNHRTGLDFQFVIGNANQAQMINFALTDSDGTEQSWSIPFTGKTPGRVYRHHIDLAKCDNEAKPGKKPGLNLKKIDSWQVRGDWGAPNVEVLLIKVTGTK